MSQQRPVGRETSYLRPDLLSTNLDGAGLYCLFGDLQPVGAHIYW